MNKLFSILLALIISVTNNRVKEYRVISGDSDGHYITTADGNVWEYDTEEIGWVSVTFDTMKTKDIHDDVIVSVN